MTDDQLVDERPLARRGPQQAPHPLHVLARAHPPDHDPDLRVGYVEPFVEHLRGDERTQLARAEAGQRDVALAPADVAGERHDEVVARDRVGRLVVRDEDQRPLAAVAREQPRQRLALAPRKREQPPRPPPRRHRATAVVRLRRVPEKVLPARVQVVPEDTRPRRGDRPPAARRIRGARPRRARGAR